MAKYPLCTTETFDPDAVWAFAKARGAKEPNGTAGFTLRYLKALKADAATLGISGRWMVAQWDLETGNPSNGNGGQSTVWVTTGNPGGIAVFPDGSTWGLTFTPEKAARAQVTHMARYLDLPNVPADWIATDARWSVPEMIAMVGDVTYVQDLGNGRWATDADYADSLIGRYTKYFGAPGKAAEIATTPSTTTTPAPKPTGDTTVSETITFGRVPKPAAKQIDTSRKPEGTGWDDLGQRSPKFVVLHRMVGSLSGTDSWFAQPNVPSLTDFGIGIAAMDGASKSGELHQYNDPRGRRSGWASGPVNGAWGDGLALVNKYGINVVNRDGVSLEISGNYDTPITASEKQRIAEFMAYWWDQMKIPYTSAPINPATGISAVVFHQEFTLGTLKVCPGEVVMNMVNELIALATSILKKYQTSASTGDGTGGGTTTPDPLPTYAIPQIPAWLLTWKGEPVLYGVAGVKDGTVFATTAQYRAIKDTPRLQYATSGAQKVGPDIKKGELFPVAFIFTAADGKQYGVTKYGTRVLLSDLEVVSDVAAAA